MQHWIRLEIQNDILINRLFMRVEPSDSSYMPSLVVVSGGDSIHNLREVKTVNISATDTLVTLLQDCTEVNIYYSSGLGGMERFADPPPILVFVYADLSPIFSLSWTGPLAKFSILIRALDQRALAEIGICIKLHLIRHSSCTCGVKHLNTCTLVPLKPIFHT